MSVRSRERTTDGAPATVEMPDDAVPIDAVLDDVVRDDEVLAAMAKAIAHPARLAILRLLSHRETCMTGDIVAELPLAQSTVSEHLRILREADLVQGEIEGPRKKYCVNPAGLDALRAGVAAL